MPLSCLVTASTVDGSIHLPGGTTRWIYSRHGRVGTARRPIWAVQHGNDMRAPIPLTSSWPPRFIATLCRTVDAADCCLSGVECLRRRVIVIQTLHIGSVCRLRPINCREGTLLRGMNSYPRAPSK